MANFDFIIGSSYGDEGKGTITARIAKQHKNQRTANVLTNGGPQRGHSVYFDGKSHIFKHFGSGTPFGAISYFSEDFILNPIQFVKEHDEIEQKFNLTIPTAIRHPCCKWTTPFDMMYNQMSSLKQWNGTCGMGIWATICRYNEMGAMTMIPSLSEFCIILDKEFQISFLNTVKNYYERKININDFPEYREAWNSEFLMEHFISDCKKMFCLTSTSENDLNLRKYEHVIFENGQGLLLTDDGSDNPEKTPSFTGSSSIKKLAMNLPGNIDINVHYVSRPYLTRHGTMNFNEEVPDCKLDKSIETNEYNNWQRKFMYGTLDVSDLKTRIEKDFSWISNWFPNSSCIVDVTHCDEMDKESEFKKVFSGNKLNFHGTHIV